MTAVEKDIKPFVPGTTGWTVHDLEDAQIEPQWFAGRHEIVEGVLTTMPPAYFAGGRALFNLLYRLQSHANERNLNIEIGTEVDVVIDETRVACPDAVIFVPEDLVRQRTMVQLSGRADWLRTRILVPPTLVIESMSPGHERHDERVKRGWYAEFSVPNYWILDAYKQTLQCLVLNSGKYATDASGKGSDEVRPTVFPELVIPLKQLWHV